MERKRSNKWIEENREEWNAYNREYRKKKKKEVEKIKEELEDAKNKLEQFARGGTLRRRKKAS